MFKGSKKYLKSMPLTLTLIIGGVLFFIAFKMDDIAMPGGEYDYVEEADAGESAAGEDITDDIIPDKSAGEPNDEQDSGAVAYFDDRLSVDAPHNLKGFFSIDELLFATN